MVSDFAPACQFVQKEINGCMFVGGLQLTDVVCSVEPKLNNFPCRYVLRPEIGRRRKR